MTRTKKNQANKANTRKIVDGPVRNIKRTKNKLLLAVGKLFSNEGYTGLNIKRIAEEANLDRKLIYTYFGSLDNLLREYFEQKDFWDPFYNKFISEILNNEKKLGVDDVFTILHGQFDAVLYNKEFQKTIHWEISEKSDIMRKIADERELIGKRLFQLTEDHFKQSNVDFPAAMALQIAGIYYLGLHAKINGSTFCGIDINTSDGRSRIENSIKTIIEDLYEKGEKK